MIAFLDQLYRDSCDRRRSPCEVAASLTRELGEARSACSRKQWREQIVPAVRAHRLYPVLLEDPFIHHSATRPRGYPGDAELLDYIYRSENIQSNLRQASALGRELYAFSSATPATRAVRNRLHMAAAEIERIAAASHRPRVMSVACGHLREAGKLNCLRQGQLERFVAADQDAVSLETVQGACAGLGVEAIQVSAKDLIRKTPEEFGDFDFIYALGLYDYLSDSTGARLLTALFGLLRPGGRVWIANFVPGLSCSGYMEAIMDWWLVYRFPGQIASLAERLPQKAIASRRMFAEPENNVAFLELIRQ